MPKHAPKRKPTAKHSAAVTLLVMGAIGIITILIFLAANPTPH